MLILDGFPTEERANAFARAVKNRFDIESYVCASEVEAKEYDLFPFSVDPVIVMVERPISFLSPESTDEEWEEAGKQEDIITGELASSFGGRFVGT